MNGYFGTLGVGAVGRFSRTLPPRTKVEYEVGYELALEVERWFHYRHDLDSFPHKGTVIKDVAQLEAVMESAYKKVFASRMKYWNLLEEAVRGHIREFKEMYQDVLAEMEFTKRD